MHKKFVVLLILSSTLLTGCGNSEINELTRIKALETEASVSVVSMSTSDKESAVYAQVSDRTLLDLTSLEEVPSEDVDAVKNYMEQVNNQLTGKVSSKDGVIDESFINYLLFEMEKTPFYFTRRNMVIKGMDATSRSIIVDVTYKTTGYRKPVQNNSYIVLGEPDYSTKMSVRHTRWMDILSEKFGKYSSGDWKSKYEEFRKIYGEPKDIIESQRGASLSDKVFKDGIINTYNCAVDSEYENSGATMTVRYVLVPNYSLGINLGFDCKHMYLTSYELDNDPTNGLEVFNREGSDAICDSIDKTLHSYYTSIDEDNHIGLYSLVNDYAKYDKFFADYFDTTYRKNDGYTISLFDITGTKISCGVTLSRKVRAKGSDMTLPIYTERYLYTLELIDGKLRITNEVLLSSKLEGEPSIDAGVAETTGFSSAIVLDSEDKKKLESLIAEFSVLQLKGDTSSDKFSEVVDISLSTSALSSIKEAMNSVKGETKVTWLTSYLQGQSNYASISVKELYQKQDNSIVECSAIYDFLYKGDKWYVYDYKISSANKLDTTALTTKNSLAICDKNGVQELNSKVTISTEATNAEELVVTGISFDYNEEKPRLKKDKK